MNQWITEVIVEQPRLHRACLRYWQWTFTKIHYGVSRTNIDKGLGAQADPTHSHYLNLSVWPVETAVLYSWPLLRINCRVESSHIRMFCKAKVITVVPTLSPLALNDDLGSISFDIMNTRYSTISSPPTQMPQMLSLNRFSLGFTDGHFNHNIDGLIRAIQFVLFHFFVSDSSFWIQRFFSKVINSNHSPELWIGYDTDVKLSPTINGSMNSQSVGKVIIIASNIYPHIWINIYLRQWW